MKVKNKSAVLMAFLAAALYALSSPVSKILLQNVSSTVLAGLLYLGAGAGMFCFRLVQKGIQKRTGRISEEKKLTKKDLPYTVGMVVLDILAPILLMLGLTMTTASNASLLNNFEIVATSLIALIIFKEKISKKLWAAISLVTLASILLTVEDSGSFSFSYGSLLVLAACVCWGFENNCTRKISDKSPLEIVVIKGFFSGTGALIIGFIIGERLPQIQYIVYTMLLGFVAYGLSIYFYIFAQRTLGAAKTSTYYAAAPFISTALSLIICRERPSVFFFIALLIMGAGSYLAATD